MNFTIVGKNGDGTTLFLHVPAKSLSHIEAACRNLGLDVTLILEGFVSAADGQSAKTLDEYFTAYGGSPADLNGAEVSCSRQALPTEGFSPTLDSSQIMELLEQAADEGLTEVRLHNGADDCYVVTYAKQRNMQSIVGMLYAGNKAWQVCLENPKVYDPQYASVRGYRVVSTHTLPAEAMAALLYEVINNRT